MTKENTKLPEGVITEEEAVNRTTAWREGFLGQTLNIRAFNIPKSDLVGLLSEDGVASVRAYLGYNANNPNNKFNLLLVGVDSNGDDMINYDNGNYIYDFTTPCPAMCDQYSPLNNDTSPD
ncbi:hypothetical protein [Croceimicrobium hydrocarbonivorans]|uniref:Uncharacterized protein n=1 Tax=Croceimicrobium hydrocarbonivorans TaxID=2761580 RepID=A0A7H0VFQ1_9FLAO|nr:hypothetical protein [Croceimicrobium hydrocarbonivorans]QNR24549.1 hypothetical protein H4K34_01530 [Croceimicrobium hydrocarbonivorans]